MNQLQQHLYFQKILLDKHLQYRLLFFLYEMELVLLIDKFIFSAVLFITNSSSSSERSIILFILIPLFVLKFLESKMEVLI